MVHKVNSGNPKTFLSHFQHKVLSDFMIDINEFLQALLLDSRAWMNKTLLNDTWERLSARLPSKRGVSCAGKPRTRNSLA